MNLVPLVCTQLLNMTTAETEFHGSATRSPEVAIVVVVCIWLLMVLACFYSGRRYSKPSTERADRLYLASLYLGTLGSLPVMIVATFSLFVPVAPEQLAIGVLSTTLNLAVIGSCVSAPVRFRGSRQKLPLVTDGQFLDRVARLAGKMGLATPMVHLLPSVGSEQRMLAFAGNLQAPELVVTDGILHRIDSDECDAIVAHELGHIANGSLWVLASVFPVSCAITTFVSFVLPMDIVLPFGFAFFVGLRRIVTRPIEIDCDHRAAQALGFRVTASAFSKFHAALPLPNVGILSCLIYATATHPSRTARIAALNDAAPADDRPEFETKDAALSWQNRASYAAFFIWLLLIASPLILAVTGQPAGWLRIPLWIVGVTPLALILVSVRKGNRIAQRRIGGIRYFPSIHSPKNWPLFVAIIALIALTLMFIGMANLLQSSIEPDYILLGTFIIGLVLVVCIVGGIALWLLSVRRESRLQTDVAVALQVHDFPRVLAHCAEHPKLVSKSAFLRHNQALANAACGNRHVAIESLEQLSHDNPQFPLAALVLSQLLLDANQPERALEVAQELAPRLKNDAAVPFLIARALRRMGRFDEARVACYQVMIGNSEDGTVQGLRAALELNFGHFEEAESLSQKSLELAPGNPFLLIVRAEILLKKGNDGEARMAVSEAIKAVRNNPFAFLDPEIAQLERELTDRFETKAEALEINIPT